MHLAWTSAISSGYFRDRSPRTKSLSVPANSTPGAAAYDAEVQRLLAVLLGGARQRGQLKGLPNSPPEPHCVRHLLQASPCHVRAASSEWGCSVGGIHRRNTCVSCVYDQLRIN